MFTCVYFLGVIRLNEVKMTIEEKIKEIERERIKEIVERKINAVIKYRDEKIKSNRKVLSSFIKLKDDIMFLIDNPDYIRRNS